VVGVTDEFVRASRLQADGGHLNARPEGYWTSLAERAPEGDECRLCGADGDEHDVRRVRPPTRDDTGRIALCASCRYWEGSQ